MAEEKKPNVVLIIVLTLAIVAIAIPTIGYFYFMAKLDAIPEDLKYQSSVYSSSDGHSAYSDNQLTDTDVPKETSADVFEFDEGHSDSNSLYNRYIGTIKNISNTTRYFVEVRGAFLDEAGNTIDTTSTFACGKEGLRPGESTKFTLSVDHDSRIKRVEYTVLDYR